MAISSRLPFSRKSLNSLSTSRLLDRTGSQPGLKPNPGYRGPHGCRDHRSERAHRRCALPDRSRADGHQVRPVSRRRRERGPSRGTPRRARSTPPRSRASTRSSTSPARAWPPVRGPTSSAAGSRTAARRAPTLLAATLAGLDRKPAVLVSGSAIGYYGDRGDEELTERSTPGDDFLAQVCVAWEASTVAGPRGRHPGRPHPHRHRARHRGRRASRSCCCRSSSGLGGPAGDGKGWWSWITLEDEVRAIRFLLDHDVRGPVNLTAPNPVTSKELAKTLGRVLHRPAVLPIPRFITKVPFGVGDLVESLLFTSARVRPTVLRERRVRVHPRRPRGCAPSGARQGRLSGLTLLRGHPDAAVDPDHLGVHVAVGEQLDGQRGELVGRAEALREEHALAELRLERLGAPRPRRRSGCR